MLIKPKDAVYQAIRDDYRGKQLDLSRSLQRQAELSAQLAQVSEDISNTRKAIAQLDAFAAERGWTKLEWGK
jgi:hypothetical protein